MTPDDSNPPVPAPAAWYQGLRSDLPSDGALVDGPALDDDLLGYEAADPVLLARLWGEPMAAPLEARP